MKQKDLLAWLKAERLKIIKEEDQKIFDEIAGCEHRGCSVQRVRNLLDTIPFQNPERNRIKDLED